MQNIQVVDAFYRSCTIITLVVLIVLLGFLPVTAEETSSATVDWTIAERLKSHIFPMHWEELQPNFTQYALQDPEYTTRRELINKNKSASGYAHIQLSEENNKWLSSRPDGEYEVIWNDGENSLVYTDTGALKTVKLHINSIEYTFEPRQKVVQKTCASEGESLEEFRTACFDGNGTLLEYYPALMTCVTPEGKNCGLTEDQLKGLLDALDQNIKDHPEQK